MIDSVHPDIADDDVDYDPITERYHVSFDPERTSRPSMIVVHLVAHLTNKAPLSLPQLYSAVETDSLDNWVIATRDNQADDEMTFSYSGYQITIDKIGNLWAQQKDDLER